MGSRVRPGIISYIEDKETGRRPRRVPMSMAVMFAAAVLMFTVLTGADFDHDNGAGMVHGAGVNGSGYVYGEDVNVDSGKYRLAYSLDTETDTYCVTGWDSGAGYSRPSGALEIPLVINGGTSDNVTSIISGAFSGCTELTSVMIPGSIISIGKAAFYGCTELMSVTISEGVRTINATAFYKCSKLASVKIPDSVESIGIQAFQECFGLTSVIIGKGTTSLSDRMFYKCTGLKYVTVPENIRSIGEYVFYECTRLTSVTISEGVESIGDHAFSGCIGLTSVKIPDSVITISTAAFYKCTGLSSMGIPGNVISINSFAFYECTGLTSVTISEGVESIGDYAFSGCTKLAAVMIPGNVMAIGDYAFSGCTNMNSITVDPGNLKFSSYDGVLYDEGEMKLIQCPAGWKEGHLDIPEGVTSVGKYAFCGCTGLTSVTIPDSVTYIEHSAFLECTGLTSVTLSKNITSINASVFEGCTGLTSVLMLGNITYIDEYAFYGCTQLTSVTIPGSVKSIGEDAFYGCTGLNTVFFEGAPVSFGMSSFSLGTPYEHVACTVYSGMEDGFLEPYKGGNTTFVYEPYAIHRLTIELNGGSFESVPNGWTKDGTAYYRDFIYGSTVIISGDDLRKEGHTFSAWDPVPSVMPDEDILLIAKWIPVEHSVIWKVLESDGTAYHITENVEYGTPLSEIVLPANDPGRTGYIFSGWDVPTGNVPDRDLTVLAKWTPVEYAITFDLTEGTANPAAEQGLKGATDAEISIADLLGDSAVTRAGHEGLTWSIDGVSIAGGKFLMPARDVLIVAGWTVTEYIIILEEGVTVKAGTAEIRSGDLVAFGTVLTVTANPRAGYTSVLSASTGAVSEDGSYTVTGVVSFMVTHTAVEHSTVFDERILTVCIVIAIILAYATVTIKKRRNRS